jgi:hypothetical protein
MELPSSDQVGAPERPVETPAKARRRPAASAAATNQSAAKRSEPAKKRVSNSRRAAQPLAGARPASSSNGNDDNRFREAVSMLAYHFWEARGFPEGSADDDWTRAECALREVMEKMS